jgi:DNA repair exonuclease SbcCD ATPase subunit
MPVGQPLDYNIPISVYGSEPLKDISICSDGQKAIIDFAFTLAILETRGIGMLYPILLDELDANLSESHRANLVGLLGDIIREEKIREFFLVNHFATLSTAIPNCEMVCLSEEGISLPPVYNRHVTIE